MVEIEDLKQRTDILLKFFNLYIRFSDSYVIEFFTSNHWDKIPKSWKEVLKDLTTPQISEFLLSNTKTYPTVWPLSLLAFKQCSLYLPILRTCHTSPVNDATGTDEMLLKLSCQEKMLKHIFRKHVKPKKQHEIYLLSKDFGSGQGHLARSLTLGYNCPVITLEQNKNFIKKAEEFDDDACKTLHKANRQADVVGQVTARHVQYNVSTDVAADIFIDTIDKKVQSHVEPTYLLTGLHACGDLSATMIRLYKESPRIAALVSVACCYMKLSTEPESTYIGYPMSLYVKGLDNHKIPYKSRESACHALEDYRCRLKGAGPQLRMHCYRAALGTILRKLHPDMVRLPVQTIKKAFNLSFVEYVALAFKKLKLSAPNEVDVQEAESLLSQWVHVVIYFCLCLMVAPTVESIILLDRMIYLKEHGLNCEIKSLFEPKLSPRCFAIIASKDSQ